MTTKFIQTKNYKVFKESVTALKERELEEFNSARMALFYGSFGIGKTWAIERMAADEPNNIIFLRAEEWWTKSHLIRKIGIEFGVENQKTADTADEIKRRMRIEDRVIVVDEVDKLLNSAKHDLLEIFRDLTDQTSCVVIFIGMEQAPIKWAKYGHYHSRLQLVSLAKNSTEDISLFCELSDVKIEPDLIAYFDRRYGNFRIIKRKIEALEAYCELHDLENADMKVYKASGAEK